MAKHGQPKEPTLSTTTSSAPAVETPETPKGINHPSKILARTLHVYKQFEAGGMKSTYQNKRYDLEVTPFGVKVESKETKRVILVPFANVLAIELL